MICDLGNVDTGRTICLGCGDDHPLPSGETGRAKVARWNEPDYWTPVTEADLDDLYLEAMLGE